MKKNSKKQFNAQRQAWSLNMNDLTVNGYNTKALFEFGKKAGFVDNKPNKGKFYVDFKNGEYIRPKKNNKNSPILDWGKHIDIRGMGKITADKKIRQHYDVRSFCGYTNSGRKSRVKSLESGFVDYGMDKSKK